MDLSNSASPQELLLGGIIVGSGLSGLGFTVILGAVGKFAPPEKRGTALGLTTMGGSIGMFLGVPVTGTFIQSFGWSGALFGTCRNFLGYDTSSLRTGTKMIK